MFSHIRGPLPSIPQLRVLWPNSLWPFTSYPMYGVSHREGARIDRQRLIGTLEDGTEVELRGGDFGVSFWLFRQELVAALREGDEGKLRRFVGLYEERHGRALIELRLEDSPLILRREGLVPGEPEVLARYSSVVSEPEE